MAWQNPYIEKIKDFSDFFIDEVSDNFNEALPKRICAVGLNFQSCILEPCSGSGGHLLSVAKAYPDCLVIGIEKRFKRAYRTLEKGAEREIHNIFLIRGDIKKVLPLLPEKMFSQFFLNFPDPWDKRRWEKYQILDAQFLIDLRRMSKNDSALFRYKTDHQENFLKGERLLQQNEHFKITKKIEEISKEDSGFITEFERLWRSRGKPIYLLEARIS